MAILAAVAQLIEKGAKEQEPTVDNPRFNKTLQLLITQQEQQAQSELDPAEAVAEMEMNQILAAREEDSANIQRLERLIMQQREEQQKVELNWRAERLMLNEKAAKQAQDAKEQVEREVSATRSAEKALLQALEFARAEVEKRARETTEEDTRKEREKADKKAKKRINRFEELFATMTATTQTNGNDPVR
ncbi:hypothetical protein CC86DRAFT_469135 [Ophiobolus disseminans]|uniref:Uncharacterized protein n=1 Tax=Ophiobolus disseminans TaxID=1469910 RepID=A0A6A6ZQC6_9PLEO|nr:hypothetical protein CC86DRAFT_469135 [Ophiobolus disseminans]